MKRFLFVFGAMVLLGGGCGSSPSTPSTTAPITATPPSSTTTAPTSAAKPAADVAAPTAPVATETPVPSVVADLEPLRISMSSGNFFFDPSTITASPGQTVSISFPDNEGTHTFVIDEIGVKKTITTGTVVTFVAPTALGSYTFYCDIGAHRKLGMEGVLIVK